MACSSLSTFRFAALAAAATLAAACSTTPAPVTVSDTVSATAVVEAVDPATRRIRLKAADGRSMMVQAGPQVRNFDRVRAGDRVTVSYTEAIAAEVVAPGAATATAPAMSSQVTPSTSGLPGGTGTVSLKGVVRVQSVDLANNAVDIVGLDGAVRRVKVVDPKAREFIRGLKPGDNVQLTFTEAVAVAVEPAR
jgi:translation initiation factor IF-1